VTVERKLVAVIVMYALSIKYYEVRIVVIDKQTLILLYCKVWGISCLTGNHFKNCVPHFCKSGFSGLVR
jgi:hypothetical protein